MNPNLDSRPIRFRDPAIAGRVSVVMPCFNGEHYLAAAIDSVMEQSHLDTELVVVDDGSTDNSVEIVRQQMATHPGRIQLLEQPNRGPYPARNFGLAATKGEFVGFLDADDYWDADCISKLLQALQSTGAPLAYCGWQNVGKEGSGGEPYVPPDYAAADPVTHFLRGCPWPIHAALLRRTLVDEVGGFSERYFTSLDYDFWLRILGATHRLVLVPEVLAYYRWHSSGQISANRHRQIIDAWRVRRDFVRQFPDQTSHLSGSKVRELVGGALRTAAYEAFWRRDLATAQALFRHALRHAAIGPRDLRYAIPAMLPQVLFTRLVGLSDGNAAHADKFR